MDVIIWFGMLFLTTRLDKFHHYMPGLDLHYKFIVVVMEEVLEMVLRLYLLLLLLPRWRDGTLAPANPGGMPFPPANPSNQV